MGNTAVELTEDAPSVRVDLNSGLQAPPLRCVLMDDSEFDRRVIRRVARQSRFKTEIVETKTIEQTRLILAQEPPDIVLVDFRVPDGDGIAFAHEICNTSGAQRPAVIVVSGEGTHGAAIRALRAGAVDFLPKDEITPDLFDGAIVNAIRAQGRLAAPSDPDEVAMAELSALRELALDRMRLLKNEVLPALAHNVRSTSGTRPESKDDAATRQDMTRRARQIPALIDDVVIACVAGSSKPAREIVDLGQVVRSVLDGDDTGALAGPASVAVGSLPIVRGDRSRLAMMFALLLHGALRACPVGCKPEISIGSGRDPKGNPIVWVVDNGLSLSARRLRLGEQMSVLGDTPTGDDDPFAWSLCQRLAEQNRARFKLADAATGGVRVMMQFSRT
ncbi:MAG: response regulator [Pseudomonadota bacterium]